MPSSGYVFGFGENVPTFFPKISSQIILNIYLEHSQLSRGWVQFFSGALMPPVPHCGTVGLTTTQFTGPGEGPF